MINSQKKKKKPILSKDRDDIFSRGVWDNRQAIDRGRKKGSARFRGLNLLRWRLARESS